MGFRGAAGGVSRHGGRGFEARRGGVSRGGEVGFRGAAAMGMGPRGTSEGPRGTAIWDRELKAIFFIFVCNRGQIYY